MADATEQWWGASVSKQWEVREKESHHCSLLRTCQYWSFAARRQWQTVAGLVGMGVLLGLNPQLAGWVPEQVQGLGSEARPVWGVAGTRWVGRFLCHDLFERHHMRRFQDFSSKPSAKGATIHWGQNPVFRPGTL